MPRNVSQFSSGLFRVFAQPGQRPLDFGDLELQRVVIPLSPKIIELAESAGQAVILLRELSTPLEQGGLARSARRAFHPVSRSVANRFRKWDVGCHCVGRIGKISGVFFNPDKAHSDN